MASQYDFPPPPDFIPIHTAKPFSSKKTILPKDKLRKLSRLIKPVPSFRYQIGTANGRNARKAVSSRRNPALRVSGVDFEIVPVPLNSSEIWPADLKGDSFDYSVEDYGTLLPGSPLRHQFSVHSLENYMEDITCDCLPVQKLCRKQSLHPRLRQFEQRWNRGLTFDEPRCPGPLYETYSVVGLAEEVKERRVYFLTPGGFISEDLLKFGKSFRQSIADEGFFLDIDIIDTKPVTPSIIKRKPVPSMDTKPSTPSAIRRKPVPFF